MINQNPWGLCTDLQVWQQYFPNMEIFQNSFRFFYHFSRIFNKCICLIMEPNISDFTKSFLYCINRIKILKLCRLRNGCIVDMYYYMVLSMFIAYYPTTCQPRVLHALHSIALYAMQQLGNYSHWSNVFSVRLFYHQCLHMNTELTVEQWQEAFPAMHW